MFHADDYLEFLERISPYNAGAYMHDLRRFNLADDWYAILVVGVAFFVGPSPFLSYPMDFLIVPLFLGFLTIAASTLVDPWTGLEDSTQGCAMWQSIGLGDSTTHASQRLVAFAT
jgi:hypothetical protein